MGSYCSARTYKGSAFGKHQACPCGPLALGEIIVSLVNLQKRLPPPLHLHHNFLNNSITDLINLYCCLRRSEQPPECIFEQYSRPGVLLTSARVLSFSVTCLVAHFGHLFIVKCSCSLGSFSPSHALLQAGIPVR